MTPRHELAQADRIGLLGDIHGDLGHMLAAISMFRAKGITVLVQLGDFGFVWKRHRWEISLNQLEDQLNGRDQTLYFVDGNHEDYDLLEAHDISHDGIRWIRTNIGHLTRGYRTSLRGGRSLAVLGGANSVDKAYRHRRSTWWEQEQISEDDLDALSDRHADILLSHDAPLGVPSIGALLRAGDKFWPVSALAYAREGRRMFHRGFLQVRPKLSVGGHYHAFVDEQVDFESPGGAFTSRIVVLDQEGQFRGNCAILTPSTLTLEIFDVAGEPYPEGTDDD